MQSLLERTRKLLDELGPGPEIASSSSSIWEDLFPLFGEVTRLPEAEQKQFVEATADQVLQCEQHFLEYLYGMEDLVSRGDWYGGEWERVCERRSFFEYFLQLYQNHWDGPWIDIEQLEEWMLDRGKDEGPAYEPDVPKDIPGTHWWWWYPNEPFDSSRE